VASAGGNRCRVNAYHRAARAIGDADLEVADLYAADGEAGIRRIEEIGEAIARVIAEYLETGRSTMRDDLKAGQTTARLFGEIPGIGEELANRISDELGAETLEDLELAAHDGRLEQVHGVGPGRAQAIRDHLAHRLSRARSEHARQGVEPSEELLLQIDREYREKSARGELRRIAPRRFNPEHEAWLPVLETERDGWELTALFSNTARAHEQNKTHDWVVIYWKRAGAKGQSTVVTAEHGRHRGERVVAK